MPEHACHVPGCSVPCPPKHLMCRGHWYMCPPHLREAVWATYQPGQERGRVTPSEAWHRAADAAIQAVVEAERQKAQHLHGVTLHRPWPDAVFYWPGRHAKLVENRSWWPRWALGKRIVIHAGRKYDRDGAAFIDELATAVFPDGEWRVPGPDESPEGIIGVATFCGVVDEGEDGAPRLIAGTRPETSFVWAEWWMGGIGWLLDDRVALFDPVACKGRQGLWRVPDDVAAEVRRQVEEVRRAG